MSLDLTPSSVYKLEHRQDSFPVLFSTTVQVVVSSSRPLTGLIPTPSSHSPTVQTSNLEVSTTS